MGLNIKPTDTNRTGPFDEFLSRDRAHLNLDLSGGLYKLQLLNASHSDVLSQDLCRGIVISLDDPEMKSVVGMGM